MDERARSVLLGLAVGDALGLPWEGLGPDGVRADAQGWPTFLGRGVVSDDTEHAYLTYRAWQASGGDVERFRTELARGLRWWFLALPPGIGFGTARSLMKLCLGWSPLRSGSTSAGNGPAMRAPVLGVLVPEEDLAAWVEVSSLVTHRDPRAVEGPFVVACLARRTRDGVPKRAALEQVLGAVQGPGLRARLHDVLAEEATGAVVDRWGLQRGVTGFIDDTVPVAVHLWLRHDDVSEAVREAVRLGGDTDTVAAIVGGLLGASGALPNDADVAQLRDRPLSGEVLRTGEVEPSWARALVRNLVLLPRIVWHLMVRRLA
jgi:ADP-ribosylglycohydrolase